MNSLYFSAVLFSIVTCLVAGRTKQGSPPSLPKFADKYHTTGNIRLPYAELNEPFEVFYDGKLKASVTSFYGGLDMVYNRGDLNNGGAVFKLTPTVIKDKIIPQHCFLINGTKDEPILPQSILPDLTGFEFSGTATEDHRDLDMWVNTTTVGTRTNKYTFYTTQGTTVLPVRYEMMGFDSLLGSHFDKYIVHYMTYKEPETIPKEKFDVPSGMACGDFPGPGVEKHIIANPYQEVAHPERGDRYSDLFQEFKEKHGRQYDNDKEHSQRQVSFTNNVRFIHAHNRQPLSFKLAINPLADRHSKEFGRTNGRLTSKGYNGGKPFDSNAINADAIPDQIDWRLMGAVSQVKDQAICGSCWSFGSTGAIEGAYFVKYGRRMRFSQQNLMDCSWDYGNNACDGGEEWRAYQYVIDHKGLMSEEDYGAYTGQNGLCHFNSSNVKVQIKSYTNVTSGSQTDLKKAIATYGPIAVGIDASKRSFSFYSDGVYYDPKCGNTTDDLDHAVLAVGYGQMGGSSYWLIKNSWSTYWGNNGYVMIDWKENNCGVAMDATYVTLV